MEIQLHDRVFLGPSNRICKLYASAHEAEMAQVLNESFPGRVAAFYSFNEDKQELFLEYVPDVNLSSNEHLDLVIRSLLQVVLDLHEQDYIHCDIHRSNFAITPTGVKLYDFESIQTRSDCNCNCNILGHTYIELDTYPKSGTLELAQYLETNDYYALAQTILEIMEEDYELQPPVGLEQLVWNLELEPQRGRELVRAWLNH